ncbi:MAG: hypothetical protein P8Y01_16270, partial [Woeseiaceae bacterium]
RHALRILGSYAAGEKLTLGIMRDKRRVTIDIEIPADFQGAVMPEAPVAPVPIEPAAPVPAAVPLPDEPAGTIVIDVTS